MIGATELCNVTRIDLMTLTLIQSRMVFFAAEVLSFVEVHSYLVNII